MVYAYNIISVQHFILVSCTTIHTRGNNFVEINTHGKKPSMYKFVTIVRSH